MILWLNGAFGVGKTTVAQAICKAVPDAFLYDPEETGSFLWNSFPPSMSRVGDFQDLPLWRSINYGILRYLDETYSGPLVVPMTITSPEYWEEIGGRLCREGRHVWHFILSAPEDVLKRRLRARGEAPGSWPEQQIERCVEAFGGPIKGIAVDTGQSPAAEIAAQILEQVGLGAGQAG